MEPKTISRYLKHAYWLTENQFREACRALANVQQPVALIPRLPGLALKPALTAAGVPPTAWNGTCKRQGSWYRHSARNGMFLLVTSFRLSDPKLREHVAIMESDFQPPRRANEQDKLLLLEDHVFQKRLPEEWSIISASEKRVYMKWAKRIGSDLNEFDTLFLSQTANHSNFIHPLLYIEDESGVPIPYSIDRSAHLCSCCVELFDIVGTRHPKKLVAPCPGAVICAGLQADRYLMTQKNTL